VWHNSKVFVFFHFFVVLTPLTHLVMVFISFFAYFRTTDLAVIHNMKLGSAVSALESLFGVLL
jgi:hypothetical protein